MKKLRSSLTIVGLVLAVGAALAFRSKPDMTVYKFITGAHPHCESVSAECPGGETACTVDGIQVRNDGILANSCGTLLWKQP